MENGLSRRQFLHRAVMLGGAVALYGPIANILAACGGGGKFGGNLNVLSWTDKEHPDVKARFKEEFGTDLQFSFFSDNEEAFAKIKTTGTSSFDTVFGDALWANEYHRAGLIEPIDFKSMSSYSDYFPKFADLDIWQVEGGKTLAIPHAWSPDGIVYNKKYVTLPDPPTFEVFFDPKYEGRVGFNDNFKNNFVEFAPVFGFEDVEVDTPEGSRWDLPDNVLETVKNEMIKARKNFKVLWKTIGDVNRAMATEEIWLTIGNNYIPLQTSDAGNTDIEFVVPTTHRVMGWIDGQMMVKNDHNRDATLEWLNFFASAESQVDITKANWLASTNKKALDLLSEQGLADRVTKLAAYDIDAVDNMSLFRPVKDPSKFQDAWAEFVAAG